MNTIVRDGFFFRIIPPESQENVTTEEVESSSAPGLKADCIPLADFIYGYTERNGQPSPVTTVCIVPRLDHPDDTMLTFGIGVSHCSEKDQPSKRVGRIIAEERARRSLKSGMLVTTKEHAVEDGIGIVGMFIDHDEECYITDLCLDDATEARVRHSFAWLTDKLCPAPIA